MLILVAVGVVFSCVTSSSVLQGLFVVTNVKANVKELTRSLDDFKVNMTAQMGALQDSLWENRKEDEPDGKRMNQTLCLQTEIQQARKEIIKLLNMLVEGEKNMLVIAESSLINRTIPMVGSDLQQLHRLWGSVAAQGKSRNTIRAEMENFFVHMKDRFEEVRKICIGQQSENNTKSVREGSGESLLSIK